MSVDMERLTRETREALVYSLGPTRNCEALFDYVGDMDFKNDFVFVVEDHDKALSEITDSAIKPALGIIKSQAAEIERLRDALILAEGAMNYMGDILNGMDAVEPEDEQATEPAFLAIRAAISGEPT